MNYLLRQSAAFNILRVGIAITFLWIGILIFKQPEAWGTIIQPWAAGLLPIPLKQAMIGTAILDVALGFCLLVDKYVLTVSIIAFLHLLTVIATVGIDAMTVRDIGLAAGALSLIFAYWPDKRK